MDDTSELSRLLSLEVHLGYWMRHVSNHVSGAFARSLQEAHQVSVTEWVALRHLYDRHGITPTELAELLGMTRGAVSKVLDKLESKGWVVRVPRPEDSRSQSLSLTPEGVALVPKLAEIADRNDEAHFACLDAEERAQLGGLLKKLAHAHEWKDVPID